MNYSFVHKKACWFTLLLAAVLLAGCGGGRATEPQGIVDGYVYVPLDRSARSVPVVSRAIDPPTGYKALPGAQVTVTANRQVLNGTTDSTGHYVIMGVPVGKASLRIVDPSGSYSPLETGVDVQGNTTVSVGTGGQVSLISHSASSLDISIDQVDSSAWPVVKTLVSVSDPVRQTAIIGLDNRQLALTVNGQSVPFSVSQKPDPSIVPAAVVLVQDCSGSMAGQPFEDAKASLRQFVTALAGTDRAELIRFDDSVMVAQPFTSDRPQMLAAIDNLTIGGSTALYDAIQQGIHDAAAQPERNRAVVVMTDGGENASAVSRSDLLALERAAKVPIYTVGLGGSGYTRRVELRQSKNTKTTREAEVDLQDIARESGGEYFFAASSTDLLGIYTKITARRQQQYVVTFNDSAPGSRTLGVQVNAFGLKGSATRDFQGQATDYDGFRSPLTFSALPWGAYNAELQTFFGDFSADDKGNIVGAGHLGVDWSTPSHLDVSAAAGGWVFRKVPERQGGEWGNYVLLGHEVPGGGTVYSLYAHLADIDPTLPPASDNPTQTSRVKRGARIGTEGKTGRATGVHLHFAIMTPLRSGWSGVPQGYSGVVFPIGAKLPKDAIDDFEFKDVRYFNPITYIEKHKAP